MLSGVGKVGRDSGLSTTGGWVYGNSRATEQWEDQVRENTHRMERRKVHHRDAQPRRVVPKDNGRRWEGLAAFKNYAKRLTH